MYLWLELNEEININMNREYINKIISCDFKSMTLNELIDYLCFTHHHQFYFDKETDSYPFKKRFYEVVQFIIEKYGVIDQGINVLEFKGLISAIESKKDSIDQLKYFVSELQRELSDIDEKNIKTEEKNNLKSLTRKRYTKLFNSCIKDLLFVPDDFFPDSSC